MEEIADITDFYLNHFRAIEAAAPDDERDIARSMIAHETAINRFARLELAGDSKSSLREVEAQLQWPPFGGHPQAFDADERLFAAIRIGKLKPGAGEEFARRVRASALPAMRQMDGFRGYFLVLDADDKAIALSLFASRSIAEASTPKLMPWIKENLGPLLASPTEAIDGSVFIAAT
jgi:hypothetical protein